MDFMIFDSAGNAVDAFASEQEAIDALLAMAAEDKRVAQHLAVQAFDAEGEAVGEPVTVADVRPEVATKLVMRGDFWTAYESLTVLKTWPSGSRIPPVAGASY